LLLALQRPNEPYRLPRESRGLKKFAIVWRYNRRSARELALIIQRWERRIDEAQRQGTAQRFRMLAVL